MSFPTQVGLNNGAEKVTSTTKLRPLGTRGVTEDGRVFYWAQAGASALTAGQVVQTKASPGASVHVAALDVVGGGTTGVTTLTVTVATTPIAKNQYADGFLSVDTTPGLGMYKIKSNEAATSGANAQFTFYDDDKLRDALTSGTTKVGVRENPYASTVAVPTTLTGAAVGVAQVAVAAASYFWAQTYGPALCNTDAATGAGLGVVVPGATAGNANVATSAVNSIVTQTIGYGWTAGAGADKANVVFLTIRS